MGKRNVRKRREAEKQQSISSGKKKVKTGGLNRKERQNLIDFGTADGDPLSLVEGEDQSFEGKTWTFGANNEVISTGTEEEQRPMGKSDEIITLLGSTTSLSSIQLGKKKVQAAPLKKKQQANPFSKLVSNLKRSKKVAVKEVLLVEEAPTKDVNVPSLENEPSSESENEDVVKDELQDASSDEDEVEPEDDSSDEEDKVLLAAGVHKLHFGDASYGEEKLAELVALAVEKKWKTHTLHPVDQANLSGPHIFLSTLEDQVDNIGELVKYSSSTPPSLNLERVAIKPRLIQPWRRLQKKKNNSPSDFNLTEGKFFYHLSYYRDVFFPLLTPQNGDAYKEAYVLHALNHVFKTRDHIIKNNFKLAKAQANGTEASEVKDSSFTRPKVLILLPFRSAALKVVNLIYQLSGCEQQENRKRFISEFALPEGEEDPITRSRAPDDHKITFAGNTDDCFKIGIKITRKSLKLYSPFYGSDIIVASPLGLRLIVGDPEASSKKKKDHDFLSSLEMLVVDQADHLLMQNWDHATHILRHSNLVPKDPHGCDFSRIKAWYLNNQSPHLRQTIVLSQMATPDLNHLFHRTLVNVAGQVRFRIPNPTGSIADTLLPTRHTFHRVTCRNHAEADDVRFEFFKDSILPAIRRKTAAGGNVLLFIPSYFDFTRIRNYLSEHEYQFGQISEYTDKPNMTRDRMAFADGKIKLLLYTGRCHFYRRFKSKGADQIIFYGLPEYASHYPEIINSANTPDPLGLEPQVQVSVLFTMYDTLKLERILGDARAQKACHGAQAALVFS